MTHFNEYKIGPRTYLYWSKADRVMVKLAKPNHRARKEFDTDEDWSLGSWGVDTQAFEDMRRAGVEDWIVKNTETGEVWSIDLQAASDYGTIATLHPSDGEQLFVPLTRFEKIEEEK